MRLDWLRPLQTDTAHICIVDDTGSAAPICERVFLTNVVKPEPTDPRCEDCTKKWKSGEEVGFTAKDGRKVVVRPAGAPVWQGSLDPFQDVAEQLSRLGVAYMLVVAIQGERRTRYWTNLQGYGHAGVKTFREQAGTLCDRVDKLISDKNDGGS
jgi:hypothetical protein